MSTTLEAVQQTLAEYERLAISTGDWDGTDAPEFSVDGEKWSAAWLPTEDHPHPLLARATAHRKGVDRPIVVVVRWDEALPAIDEWRELWLRKPVALFGAFTIRAALRRAFRDVIGERREPDEVDVPSPAVIAPKRDWFAELEKATTREQVLELHASAKAARQVTVDLERAIRLRLRYEDAAATGEVTPVVDQPRPKPTPPKVRLEDTVRKPQPKRSRR